MIRKDGYYISEAFNWVDWHAGHKFEGVNYKILVFRDNNYVIRVTYEDKNSVNIKKSISDSSTKDIYKIKDNIVEIIIDPHSRFSKKREFTILSPEILLDENLIEYRFMPTALR